MESDSVAGQLGSQPTPVRRRSEATFARVFCLLFQLSHGEGRLLARLMVNDFCCKAELQDLHEGAGRARESKAFSMRLSTLRRKLGLYNIEIDTLGRSGFALERNSRSRICTLLNKYDTQFVGIKKARVPRASDPSKAPQLNLFEPNASNP